MRDKLTGRQFEIIKAIMQNDSQQFCDLGGLFFEGMKEEINESKLFPLALAVIHGHLMMTQLIVKNKYSDADQIDANGWNVLHFAARYD